MSGTSSVLPAYLAPSLSVAWTGMNGSKAGASKNHQGKQSASDVNSYFKINDIDKLINIAINKVPLRC
eukprot:766192-Hanusia_phi.AAC.6